MKEKIFKDKVIVSKQGLWPPTIPWQSHWNIIRASLSSPTKLSLWSLCSESEPFLIGQPGNLEGKYFYFNAACLHQGAAMGNNTVSQVPQPTCSWKSKSKWGREPDYNTVSWVRHSYLAIFPFFPKTEELSPNMSQELPVSCSNHMFAAGAAMGTRAVRVGQS